MTPATQAAALLVAALVGVLAAAVAAVALGTVSVVRRRGQPRRRARHALTGRHACDRREFLQWTVSSIARFFRDEDGGAKTAVTGAALFLAFAVLIGASQ